MLSYVFFVDVCMLCLVLVLVMGGVLLLWVLFVCDFCMGDNLFGGIGVGLIIVGMWYVLGYFGYV